MSRRKKLPYVLNKEEQQALLDQFNDRYPTAKRNKTMIKLMLDTGLRLEETINLKWKNIDLMSGKIEVKEGKGAKDRIVYANNGAFELLRTWKDRQVKELQNRGIEKPPELVFTSLKGNKLNKRNVRRMIYKYAVKAGIQEEVTRHYRDDQGNRLDETYQEKKVTPHTLRHTFATDLYRESKNIRLVQKALGHEDLSTTMIYTHIVDDELEQAMKSFREEGN